MTLDIFLHNQPSLSNLHFAVSNSNSQMVSVSLDRFRRLVVGHGLKANASNNDPDSAVKSGGSVKLWVVSRWLMFQRADRAQRADHGQ